MKKHLLFTIIFLSCFFFVFGCAAPTKMVNYQPKSAQEQEVLDCMAKLNEAMVAEDVTNVMALHHENAEIRTVTGEGDRVQSMASKQKFKEYLEAGGFEKMNETNIMEDVKISDTSIKITGDRATITGVNTDYNVPIRFKWDLIKENEKWLIKRADWWW